MNTVACNYCGRTAGSQDALDKHMDLQTDAGCEWAPGYHDEVLHHGRRAQVIARPAIGATGHTVVGIRYADHDQAHAIARCADLEVTDETMQRIQAGPTPDPIAAGVHRRAAEVHYEAAEKFRRLGLADAERAALAAARKQDELSEALATASVTIDRKDAPC